jgi:thioesterase domain-containing protein
MATRLVRRIHAKLDLDLSVRTLFERPTVAALSESFSEPASADIYEIIFPIKSLGTGTPIFCIHAALGLSSVYSTLIPYIDNNYPIYGVQARGLSYPTELPNSIVEMASEYLTRIKAVQGRGPYNLLGWSFGGLVAQAIACLAQQEGEEIGILALLDAIPRTEEEEWIDIPGAEYLESIFRVNPAISEVIDDTHRTLVIEIIKNNRSLRRNFEPSPYSGDALLFVATHDHEKDILENVWRPYINGGIKAFPIDCSHNQMLQPGPISQIAKVLTEELNRLSHSQACEMI